MGVAVGWAEVVGTTTPREVWVAGSRRTTPVRCCSISHLAVQVGTHVAAVAVPLVGFSNLVLLVVAPGLAHQPQLRVLGLTHQPQLRLLGLTHQPQLRLCQAQLLLWAPAWAPATTAPSRSTNSHVQPPQRLS